MEPDVEVLEKESDRVESGDAFTAVAEPLHDRHQHCDTCLMPVDIGQERRLNVTVRDDMLHNGRVVEEVVGV